MSGRIPPKLDNRSFEQLRAEAIERLQAACPAWTDLSPSDPGIALVEAFSYLTQVMLYRLNRVPEKQYNAFLRLLGITPLPPAAATTTLVFSRTSTGTGAISIPAATRVAVGPIVFTTNGPAQIEAGSDSTEVQAYHGEFVDGELLTLGTGTPGLEVRVSRPPIVAPMLDGLDLIVAVEEPEPLPPDARAIRIGQKTFRIWREVSSFANLRPNERVFSVDRGSGIIRFPPAADITDESGVLRQGKKALGAFPAQGREIRASYRTGGGAAGNVAAGTLTTLRDGLAGVAVTNPAAASGGRDAESFENTLIRGPTDFQRLDRAVTSRDVEALARRASGVARAKAFTKSAFWKYAPAGTIEVRLVPTLGANASPLRPTLADLRPHASDELAKVHRALDLARPMGSRCEVDWTNLKCVSVLLEVVVSRQEDRVALQRRILERLYRLITPLPRSAWDEGWAHGRALRRYDVEGAIRSEPGVLYTNRVELIADDMPQERISTIAVDQHQPRTFYAGSGPTIYRTVDGGDGWEAMQDFSAGSGSADEIISIVRASREHPGHIAVATEFMDLKDNRVTKLYVSGNCGESWELVNRSNFKVRDAAWSTRNGTPLLFLATDGGLWELLLNRKATPLQVGVTGKADQGFNAIVAHEDVRGVQYVVVATNDLTGVYLSRAGGRPMTFERIGLVDRDVGELGIQRDNVKAFLWAGLSVPGAGTIAGGALRYELLPDPPNDGWIEFQNGWKGGSVLAFGFSPDGTVLAGSHSSGVLWLEPGAGARWQVPRADVGLPVRDEQMAEGTDRDRDLFPIATLGVDSAGTIVAGTIRGVFRAADPTGRYVAVTNRAEFPAELREFVTLPPAWLFRSGEHTVIVKSEDEIRGDTDAGA